MEFYESTSTDPYYNLALEDYFFTHMDPMKDYFLLWQNDKAVIVGKYQNTLEEVDQTFVDERGIRVARRLSGGGAVYHDLGNLNYTFIVEEDRAEAFRFEVFTKPLLAALKELGVAAVGMTSPLMGKRYPAVLSISGMGGCSIMAVSCWTVTGIL